MTSNITLDAINCEAQRPAELASFWAAVLGSVAQPSGDTAYVPAANADGFAMFFQPVGGARPDCQTLHLDLHVPWGERHLEVERIIGLGATFRWDVLDEYPHVQWTTLGDPEGNLFCIAEHPPAQVPAGESGLSSET